MQRIIKLWAKAPNVTDLTIIEAATSGLRVGSCQDYLDRCKPNIVGELFNVMQEYCKSDRGRRRTRSHEPREEGKNKPVVAAEAMACGRTEAARPEACEHSIRRPTATRLSKPIKQGRLRRKRMLRGSRRPRASGTEGTILLLSWQRPGSLDK
jgi:hypothetical protein